MLLRTLYIGKIVKDKDIRGGKTALKIAIGQLNPTVGDIVGNVNKIEKMVLSAVKEGARLIIFPELSVTGYPPRDLLLYEAFTEKVLEKVHEFILPLSEDINIILGLPQKEENCHRYYNSALHIYQKKIVSAHNKTLLPNYDVFDESRYFIPAKERTTASIDGKTAAVTVCEDIWNDKDYFERLNYADDPVAELYGNAPDFLINISASPYHLGKASERASMLSSLAKKYRLPLIYVNQTGGNDELVFDGSSMVFSGGGELIFKAEPFTEGLFFVEPELSLKKNYSQITEGEDNNLKRAFDFGEDAAWVHDALSLGLRDYLGKSGFSKVAIGLSGGIDSAVVAALAVNALGAQNVCGVMMPSRYSSSHSVEDSEELAHNLGIEARLIHIEGPFKELIGLLNPGKEAVCDLAEENLQARIRGNILMFISNREGKMILPTGNKSELAVGYCTLYGDMCGGIGVLADLPKQEVYKLARYINQRAGVSIIPESIIEKAPSAELRPDQKDEDSLPPYNILDEILDCYIVKNMHLQEIVNCGFNKETVKDIISLVDKSEYKRSQAAPGLRITTRAFGSGRRMPLAKGRFY